MNVLDPVSLSKIASLQLRARQVVDGLLAGLHTSRQRGHSLEFAQHREYVHGDELRHIDWKMHGRTDRFFVKQYQDETNLRCCLLLDASGSMGYSSSGDNTKLAYGATAAAALSYLLLKQGDAAGLGIFSDTLQSFLPPMHQQSYLPLILSQLSDVQPGGDTGIGDALRESAQRLKKRSMVIVLSDLMGDEAQIISALRHLSYRHYDVLVLQILDPREVDLQFAGETLFEPLESGESVRADADEVRREYQRIFQDVQNEYAAAFRAARIDHTLALTNEPVEQALLRLLARRTKR